MNFFKNLFKKKDIPKQTKISIDELFARNFTKKGGKFIYCTSDIEVQDTFRQIVKELGITIKMSSNNSDTINEMFEENETLFATPIAEADVYLTDCECLVADVGGIMFSSHQIKHKKIDKLPETFIVFARTSQLVKDIAQGMRTINKKYCDNQKPTGLMTLQNFIQETDATSIETYGVSSKETYLILLENITSVA